MQATVKWVDEMVFLGETESGHRVDMEAVSVDAGGKSSNPLELILQSLGACSASDVVSILLKSRLQIDKVEVLIKAQRAETIPKVFTAIQLHFLVTGAGISDTQVKRAVDLSLQKYCSVAQMLRGSVNITHGYEVVNR